MRTEDGCEIAAYDFGGDGEPLLLVHATGFHAQAWLPVVRHLRGRFHCYAIDERGHGASPTPTNGDFHWRTMGDDTRAVVRALELGACKAVGHSGGGAHLIMAEQDHPGTWEAIWSFEPVVPDFPIAATAADNPLAGGALRRRAHFESREAGYENFASKALFATFDPEALRLYVDHGFVDDPNGGVTLACRPEDEAEAYRGAAGSGAFERLAEVGIPVHVVCGEVSTHLPAPRLTPVVERLRHGSLEVMSGVGHFGPFEAPERVAESILGVLG